MVMGATLFPRKCVCTSTWLLWIFLPLGALNDGNFFARATTEWFRRLKLTIFSYPTTGQSPTFNVSCYHLFYHSPSSHRESKSNQEWKSLQDFKIDKVSTKKDRRRKRFRCGTVANRCLYVGSATTTFAWILVPTHVAFLPQREQLD